MAALSVLSRVDAESETGTPMRIEFFYDTDHPFEVSATFMEAGNSQNRSRWVFSRDLLIAGNRQRSGDGDITIDPLDNKIYITIRGESPDEALYAMTISCHSAEYGAFILRTLSLVPLGQESVTIPDDISSLV